MFSDRLTSGFALASQLHANHRRKGTESPYLSHLLGVASLVMEYGGDEDAVIAAMLHDAVEDCGGQSVLDQISTIFGDEVADVVAQCSDSVAADAADKAPWADRKRSYIAAIATKTNRACLVTACDKLHNANAILADHNSAEALGTRAVWDRFSGKPREQVVAYYTALNAQLSARVPPELAQRLAETTLRLEALVDSNSHREWVANIS